MRGPTPEEILNAQPHDLRTTTKTAQAYLDLRRKILTGEYKAHQLITPKAIDDEYKTSNTSSQIVLLRLAGEGLIKILPINGFSKIILPEGTQLNHLSNQGR